MSSWAQVRDTLASAVASCLGLPVTQVSWAQGSQGVADPAVDLALVSDVTVGRETVDTKAAPGPGPDTSHLWEIHHASAQVMISTSMAYDQTPEVTPLAADALGLIGQLRTALGFRSVIAAMRAGGVTLIADPGRAYMLPARGHGQMRACWAIELPIRFLIDFADPTSQEIFTSYSGSGTILQPGETVAVEISGP